MSSLTLGLALVVGLVGAFGSAKGLRWFRLGDESVLGTRSVQFVTAGASIASGGFVTGIALIGFGSVTIGPAVLADSSLWPPVIGAFIVGILSTMAVCSVVVVEYLREVDTETES